MDGLPGTAVMGDCDDIRYLPGGDPDQILTLEPCLTASVNGQKISLLRAALWQREDGRRGCTAISGWIPGASGSGAGCGRNG